MSERIAVLLGCGMVGTEVARLLAADETFDRMLAADKDAIRAHQMAEAVGAKITATQVDSYDEAAVAHLAQGASVVLNTTGPFTPQVRSTMRGALLAGVPYADINDEAEVLYKLFESGELDTAARQRGVPLVVGLGTSPGLTNIWARHLADQMDALTAFHIAIVMDPGIVTPRCSGTVSRSMAAKWWFSVIMAGDDSRVSLSRKPSIFPSQWEAFASTW